jgi:hypothetical protein
MIDRLGHTFIAHRPFGHRWMIEIPFNFRRPPASTSDASPASAQGPAAVDVGMGKDSQP